MEYLQPPESEHDSIVRMLRTALAFDAISPEEAAEFYLAYLDVVESELVISGR